MQRFMLLLMQTFPPMRADYSILVSLCSFQNRSVSTTYYIRCPFSYSPEYLVVLPSVCGRLPSVLRKGSDFFRCSVVDRKDSSFISTCSSDCGLLRRSSLIKAFPWRSLRFTLSLLSRIFPSFFVGLLLLRLPLMDRGLSIVALEMLPTLSLENSAVSILLCPWEKFLILWPLGRELRSMVFSLWSSSNMFRERGSSRCVLAPTSGGSSGLSAWIRIIMGEHPGVFEVYRLFGLLRGLKTLKNPVTSSSSGMVCLSSPWNLSWTVSIWLSMGAQGGMKEQAIYKLLLSQCSESSTSCESQFLSFSMNLVSVEQQQRLMARKAIFSITSFLLTSCEGSSKQSISKGIS